MAKNAGRKGRWTQRDARTYTSSLGLVAYREEAWYARLAYQVRESPNDGNLPRWVAYDRWLGPYKRPRNAMVELEREATFLRNRHGSDVRIGEETEPSVGPLPPG
jgi:hypothetical protein